MKKPIENSISIDVDKRVNSVNADNNLHTIRKSEINIDFSSGMAGAAFAGYSIARGTGNAGTWGVHDIVGHHGTAVKDGIMWAAGLHADVYDTTPGGTAIGLNIEFPLTQKGTDTIGVNIQPNATAKDLIGIQIQNPDSFKYSLFAPNMSIVFGQVDTCLFGMRFNPKTQSLEFFRNVGNLDEVRVGILPMDFSKAQ